MTFLSDLLRIGGVLGGAALSATGVASPLGAALIGAVLSVPTNLAASAIERSDASDRLNEAESQAKDNVDTEAKNERDRLHQERQESMDQATHEREQASVSNQILELCRRGNVQQIPELLQQLDDPQFEDLGLEPLAFCHSQEIVEQVAQMLENEVARRENSRRRARP